MNEDQQLSLADLEEQIADDELSWDEWFRSLPKIPPDRDEAEERKAA